MTTVCKKVILFSCLFMFSAVSAKKHRTKKLQLLVVPGDASYFFALNDGGPGINYNPSAPRPQGAYYVTNAFIFPGRRIDKNQTDFSIDKDGNPISLAENMGMAYFIETMLQTVDYANNIIPAPGTAMEAAEIRFEFRYPCDGMNVIYSMGLAMANTFPPTTGVPIVEFSCAVTGATGCNSLVESYVTRAYGFETSTSTSTRSCCEVPSCYKTDCDPKPIKIRGNGFKGKIYLAQTGTVAALVNIRFEEDIVYSD